MAILDDPDRTFATSVFLWLEVMPKPLHHGRAHEAAFYERVLRDARQPDVLDGVLSIAQEEARTHGLSALDALHIAAAVASGAAELVTGEKRSRPIYRTKRITVRSIRA